MLFLPLAQHFEPPQAVLVLTSILHVFANSFRMILFWNPKALKTFKKAIFIFFITTGLGAFLSLWITHQTYKVFLGSLLIVFVITRLVANRQNQIFFNRFSLPITGLAGLLTGWLGTGGALRAMTLTGLSLKKTDFIFISSSIDWGGDVFRSIVYLSSGYLKWEHLPYIPALAVCAWIGSRIGKLIVAYIPQQQFERLTLILIFITGLITLWGY